ncbi:hypothetical protein AB0D91_05380 [Streptomyces canus]|uniref:hypothetical protein n=1 Tax=Streptomyces canus TaxID=58343 RepID=UPI0033DCA191
MTPKRGDDAAPPPIDDEYRIVFATTDAAKGWDDFRQQEPTNLRWAFDQMRHNPGCCNEPPNGRHSRMKRDLATGTRNGRTLPQWQLEVTSSGRIWYLCDDVEKTCWIQEAGRAHPKKTEG